MSIPLPRYSDIWDIDCLLSHLETLHPPDILTDYQLSVKTCAMLSRASSVAALAHRYQLIEDEIVVPIVAIEKTSRPGDYDSFDMMMMMMVI